MSILDNHLEKVKSHIEKNPGLSALSSHLHDVVDLDEVRGGYTSNWFLRIIQKLKEDHGLVEENGRWYFREEDA